MSTGVETYVSGDYKTGSINTYECNGKIYVSMTVPAGVGTIGLPIGTVTAGCNQYTASRNWINATFATLGEALEWLKNQAK